MPHSMNNDPEGYQQKNIKKTLKYSIIDAGFYSGGIWRVDL